MNITDKPKIKPQQILLGKEDKELDSFDLIEIQKQSWGKFINIELKEILNEFFPIEDWRNFVIESEIFVCDLK